MRSPLPASYDFVAFARHGTLELVADVETRVTSGPTDSPRDRLERDRLAGLLRHLHPSLSPFLLAVDLDLGPHAPVRLASADERGAVHVALHDDHATLSLPYWTSDSGARVTLRHAWEYLKIVRQERHVDVYDVQEERLVDLSRDYDRVLAGYLASAGRLAELVTERRLEATPPT